MIKNIWKAWNVCFQKGKKLQTEWCTYLPLISSKLHAQNIHIPLNTEWETLHDRRWLRRLCRFFKLRKVQFLYFLFAVVPHVRPMSHNLRHSSTHAENVTRTAHYSNTYFYNTLLEWNSCEELNNSSTLTDEELKILQCSLTTNWGLLQRSLILRACYSHAKNQRERSNLWHC